MIQSCSTTAKVASATTVQKSRKRKFQRTKEFQEEEEVEEDYGWMQGWHPSRNKPENLCKYLRGLGLCTVFPYGNAYKLVVGGQFYGPFPTQEEAQLAAKSLKP